METATDACSAALMIGGETRARHELTPRRHGKLIVAMVQDLLAQAGLTPAALDGFAVGRGPGSFTGVRVSVALIQGLAYAADRPVAPVSTLAALAWGTREPVVATLLDARMGEVYAGVWRRAGSTVQAVVSERVAAPEALPELPDGVAAGVGPGFAKALARRLPAGWQALRHDASQLPHAAAVAELARPILEANGGLPAAEVRPVYLRDRVADESARASG